MISPPAQARFRGLTLLEMLTVIGILLLALAIANPILRSARERGRQAVCFNNLRLLGAAVYMYADAFDGYVPPYPNGESLAGIYDPDASIRSEPTNSKWPMLLVQSLRMFGATGDCWFCLSDPYRGQARVYKGLNHRYSSYGYAAPVFLYEKNKAPFPMVLMLGTRLWRARLDELPPCAAVFSEPGFVSDEPAYHGNSILVLYPDLSVHMAFRKDTPDSGASPCGD